MKNEVIEAKPVNEVAVSQSSQSGEGIMSVITLAIEKGAGVDQLDKLLSLQERFDKNEAKKAFDAAMARFKKNPPKVTKDKKNSQYNSSYAGIANIVTTISSALSEYGFTTSWDQAQDVTEESHRISVTCKLRHAMGHEETSTLSGSPDDSGKKNPLQQIKSTVTYLRIATFESVTGIVASDEGDDDGNSSDGMTLDEVIKLMEGAKNLAELDARAKHASQLTGKDKDAARDAYKLRKEELSQ